jgi:hypothetical protein
VLRERKAQQARDAAEAREDHEAPSRERRARGARAQRAYALPGGVPRVGGGARVLAARSPRRNTRSIASSAGATSAGLNRPQDITRPILERYQPYVYPLPQAQWHAALGVRAARVDPAAARLVKWMTKQNHILYNPAADRDLPTRPKALSEVRATRGRRNGAHRELHLTRPSSSVAAPRGTFHPG